MPKLDVLKDYPTQALEDLNLFVVILDTQGMILYLNKKAQNLLGYEDKNIQGDWYALHVPAFERERRRADLLACFANPELAYRGLEVEVITRGGSSLSIRWHNSLIYDSSGKAIALLGAGEDVTAQRREEARLQTNDLYYAATLASIGDGLLIVDLDSSIVYLNPVAERMTGWNLSDAKGRPLSEVFNIRNAHTGEPAINPVERALCEGRIQALANDTELLSKSGERYQIADTAAPVSTEDGSVRGVVLVFHDVSSQYAAHAALAESETRFRKLIQAMPLGIHRYRLEGIDRLIFCGANPAADAILHLKHEDFIGKEMLEVFPSLAATDIPKEYRKLATGGPVLHREDVSYDDGKIVGAFEINAFGSGEGQMAVVFSDIIERKRAERERDRYFNLSLDMIFLAGFDGFLKDANPAAVQLLGYSKDELLATPWLDFVHPEDRAATLEAGSRLQEGNKVVNFENRYMRKDGQYRWLSWNSLPLPGERSIVAIVRDVTEQRQQLDRLRQSEKMEAIGRLAGGIAHDFNNQLAGIMGCAEIVQAQLGADSPLQEYVNLILNATKTSADLTGQLLAFARKGKFQSLQLDAHDLIREVMALLSRTIDPRVRLETKLSPDPALILGDPSQLQTALMNLSLNARDAMPSGGVLCFSTETIGLDADFLKQRGEGLKPGPYLRMSIADTGMGMDAETRAHLFEPFFTTKAEGHGTGLGLAAVYGIVQNHHGFIDVSTERQKGTTFYLYIPCAKDKQASSPTINVVPEIAPQKGAGASILIVDDERLIRLMAETMLSLAGYKVASVASGKDALVWIEGRPCPDLILLDLVMSDMNGAEAFEKIREKYPKAKILISSGYNIDETAQRLLDSGARGFIQKPYRKNGLYTAVEAALGS